MNRVRRPVAWVLVALALLWTIKTWAGYPYQAWRTGVSAAALVFTAGLLVVTYAPALPQRRKLMAVGAAGLLAAVAFAEGGGLRYTYGSDGEIAYAYTMQTTQIAFGVNTSIPAVATITNIGSTTVRLAPDFSVKAIGPDGGPVYIQQQGCANASRAPSDDHIFIELTPGASRAYGLGFSVLWVANASAPDPTWGRPCGAFVLDRPGTYQLTAVLSSGPPFEGTTLPVWHHSVAAPVTPFTAA